MGFAARTVTALVTHEGRDLGSIGPFQVASPWWADAEPVARYCRAVLGVNVAVVRLVDVSGGISPRAGHVTYHVEALRSPSAVLPPANFAGLTDAARHRAAWATPDGVREALAWAAAHVSAAGQLIDVVEQVKSWNLSALFRIPVAGGDSVWLKLTPPFAAHEPSVTALVASVDGSLVPTVLASDVLRRRALLSHVPGTDCWDADSRLIRTVVARWVAAQAQLATRPGASTDAIEDRRLTHLGPGLATLLDGEAGAQLQPDEFAAAGALLERLPALVAELDECGLPDTLVHGDFHPGNWRSDGAATVLIDFADAFWGHPACDGERLREFVGPDRAAPVVEAWCAAWQSAVPGSDPARALRLVRPLQALAAAIGYQRFLDNIEASERRYHELDPPQGLRDALAALSERDATR